MSALILTVATAAAVAAWAFLLLFRGGYWRLRERLPHHAPAPDAPLRDVAAIMPARNEADVIRHTLQSVMGQDYAGTLRTVVVDDQSTDGTADVARAAVPDKAPNRRLLVLRGGPRPAGWAPKVWAMHQGYRQVLDLWPDTGWIWLTDADVGHDPGVLTTMVQKAEAGSLDQVSTMVVLRIDGAWERLLIPAFVLFFAKLYPFRWANDPRRKTAAAAGGCILAAQEALADCGGFEAIHDAWIDDCALAARLKLSAAERQRGTWLGVSDRSRSIRGYGGLPGVWRMVARSAYTQLRHSPLWLLATVLGMTFLYLLPPLAVLSAPLHGSAAVLWLGVAAWGLMAVSLVPALRLYRQPAWLWPVLALALPVAGLLYTAMTIHSAISHVRGRGAAWKGRRLGATS